MTGLKSTDWKPEKRIKEIYDQYNGDHDKVLIAVAKEFGWTIQQAYIATEHLYRPENMN